MNPMTAQEMIDLLKTQPSDAIVVWTNSSGKSGYFYEADQDMEIDDEGCVYLELGPLGDPK